MIEIFDVIRCDLSVKNCSLFNLTYLTKYLPEITFGIALEDPLSR